MTTTRASRRLSPGTVPINPTAWSAAFGFDQGQVRTAPTQILTIAGQGPLDAEGRLVHEGDPVAQLALTLANVGGVLDAAGMTTDDLASMRLCVTDIDAVLAGWDTVLEFLDGAQPPSTLVEVSRLAVPGMTVEIDATAIRCSVPASEEAHR